MSPTCCPAGLVLGRLQPLHWNSDYLGYNSSGTIDTVNAVAAVHPRQQLSLSASLNYSDNLTGQLIQSVVAAGGVVPGLNSNQSSNSLDLMGVATYTPLSNLQTIGFRRAPHPVLPRREYGVTSYGGGATYAHSFSTATSTRSVNVTANTADKTGEDTLGFSTNENYSS